jgi:hypothetical protein
VPGDMHGGSVRDVSRIELRHGWLSGSLTN